MTTNQDILKEAARIVRTELPKHLSDEFTINDVEAESLPGPDDEEYIHINVILKDNHPELDARELLQFKQAVRPMFENAGVMPIPAISFSNAGEFTR